MSDTPITVDENLPVNAVPTSTKSATVNTPVASEKKSKVGLWIALILFLLIAAVAAFLWHQYKAIQHLQSALAVQAEASDAAQRDQAQKLANDLAAQQKLYQSEIREMSQRLDSTAATVLALTNISRDDWKLMEVDFLLRMANQRVLIGSYFTMEYSIEAAAFFNPSMMEDPDQSGLSKGEKRVIISFRAT
ncbi:MAG: hypothetical protein EOO68_30195, partial [Moraxellaceae bacterium]